MARRISGVVGRSAEGGRRLSGADILLSHAVVGQLDVALVVEQDVVQLKVPVNDDPRHCRMIIITILIVIRNDNDDDNHHTKKARLITLMRSKKMTKMMIIILMIMITLMRSKSASTIMPERAVGEALSSMPAPWPPGYFVVVGEVDALLRHYVFAAAPVCR